MRASHRIVAAILTVALVAPLAGPVAAQQPSGPMAPSTTSSPAPDAPRPVMATPADTPPMTAPGPDATPPVVAAPPSTPTPTPPPPPTAQASQPVPPPPAGTPPPPPPGPVQIQPELWEETLRASRGGSDHAAAYGAGAAVVNVFLVPGRVITCALGGTVGVGVLILTLGTGYRAAAGAWREGCGGKWIVNGDDLRPKAPSVGTFDWESP